MRPPWGAWLLHAVSVLGLAPREFWRLSLAEWRALIEAHATGTAPLTMTEFEALMRAEHERKHPA
jgi:hypothetical protein